MDQLARDGFQAITIVDPGVKVDPAYAIYTSGLEKNLFLRHADGRPVTAKVWPGETHHPDFTNPAARTWWADAHKALFEAGVRGIWCDMNEPAIWGDSLKTHDYPPDAVHHDEGSFRSHREVHNIYGHCMAKSARMALEQERPNERPFVLTRSGWAGMQRNTAVWTGDNRSCFGSMPLDLAQVLSFGVCGVAHAGCDIGGFQNDGHSELFLRWMEWGVFQPFCRAHSAWGTARQEPWSFGPKAEDASRSLLLLRMQLLPYLYTLFVEASRTGMPVVRPLFLAYPDDLVARRIGDEFLLGSDVLVAPVMEAGRDRRMVYLPEGEWIAGRDGARHAGGQWIIAELPLGLPPVFWRAGAAIPVEFKPRQHTGEAVAEAGFRVYAGPDIRGTWVADDGISWRFREGEQTVLDVTGAETGEGAWVSVKAEQSGYELPCACLALEFVASRPVRTWSADGITTNLANPESTVRVPLSRISSAGVRVVFEYA
jgi:alpha-glucosidase